MARTHKDKKWKLRYPEYAFDFDEQRKLKKRKSVDSEWHWMSTPSWWTRLMMNRPQRRAAKVWERKVLMAEQIDETVDVPNCSNKPHIYYW
jgi:hypothetical protein